MHEQDPAFEKCPLPWIEEQNGVPAIDKSSPLLGIARLTENCFSSVFMRGACV